MFTEDLRGIEGQDAGMRPLLDAAEMLDSGAGGQSKTRNEPRVTIPSRETEIYKATLVSLLNQDPQLSHERSVRLVFFILARYSLNQINSFDRLFIFVFFVRCFIYIVFIFSHPHKPSILPVRFHNSVVHPDRPRDFNQTEN